MKPTAPVTPHVEIPPTASDFFEAFFDQHSAVMLLIDPQSGRILRANRAARDYYGYKAKQFQRLTIHRINTLGQAELEARMKEALAQHRNYFVARHRLANGDVRDVEVFSSPFQFDGCACLLSIISDIGVYISMERHGHQLVQEYQALFERIPDGVYRSTPGGRLLAANPALVRMLGYASVDELLKVDIARDLYVDSAERQRFLLELDQKDEAHTASIRLRRKDGSVLHVLNNSHAVRNDKGDVQYYEGVLTDITELLQVEETLARRVNELELLYEHGLTLSMTLEPHQVARQLIELMDKKLHWHHAAIRQFHPETNRVELLALNIPDKDEEYIHGEVERLNHLISHPGQGLSGWALEHDEVVRSGAVQTDPRYIDTYPGLQSGLYVPIKVGERAIGSIAVESGLPDAFDENDERLLMTLAAQAGVAIDNARLFMELQERADEFALLYETTRDLTTYQDFHALLDVVSERAARLLGSSGGGIYLYEAQSRELELVSLPDGSLPLGKRLQLGEGLSGRVAETREPLAVSDYSHWEGRSSQYKDISFRSVLGLPMLYGGELLGVLNVYDLHPADAASNPPHAFDETDIRLASLFAGAAAGAVYGARLLEQANRRAEELGMLARVSSALRLASTRVQMMPVILDQLLDILPSDGAFLAFLHPANDDLSIDLARGSLSGLTAYNLPPNWGSSSQVIQSRQPVIVDDLREVGDFFGLEGARQVCAAMIVPLMVHDHVMGVLAVGRDFRPDGSRPQPFGERQQRMVTAIADMAANAMHRAELHEQTALHAEQMTAVSRLGHLLAEATDLNTIYKRLEEGIYALLPDICGLFISLYDVDSNLIRCAHGHMDGVEVDVSQLAPLPFDPAAGGKQSRVLDSLHPLIVNILEPPREGSVRQFVGRPDKMTAAALYVPMLTDGKATGLIQVQSYSPGRFEQKDVELLALVANTAAVEIENTRLIARYERHVQRLTALHAIDTAINSSTDMRLSLRVALEQSTHLLNMEAASVLLLNPITLTLEFAAGSGFALSKLSHAPARLGEGLAGRAALLRARVESSDAEEIAACFLPGQAALSNFQGYIALPLIAKGKVSGILQFFNLAPIPADQEWLDFLYVLGDQVALAVNNASLFEGLERANLELTMAYDATIEGWSRALDLRDRETEGHTQRVTELTVTLARVMGLPEASIPHIRRGALLHDIGKMGVPDEILRKPGPLTEEEWRIMHQHPRHAYDLLSPIVYLRPALDIPYCHHEKWDGSGYPRGLKGDVIPLAARLFAVVDVFDALTSDRPYRPAWPLEKALALIRDQSGRHFDPDVTEIFLQFIEERSQTYRQA